MRRFPVLLLAATLVAACAGTSPTPTGPSPTPSGSAAVGGIELAMANGVAHLAGSASNASSAGAALSAFGLDLYAQLRDGSGNMVISPASVAIALAMARAGARGTTASEMDAVLHGLAADGHAAWVASLDNALNDRSGTFDDPSGKPQTVTLRVTNGSFVQRGLTLQPAYLDALAAQFGAGVQQVDFKQAAEAARSLINGWVSDQTEQRIKELLAQGTIDDMTRLVLVNAIYLKAAWLTPFEVSATQPGEFRTSSGTTVTVPYMHSYGSLEYASGAGWQAVQLPYVGHQLAMLVIVPDDLATFEGKFDSGKLDEITGALASREVDLSLPRFGAETSASLGGLLAQLGMPSAFDASTADFSGITTEERLFISAVVHQANIDVDEAGTEAAAATAVAMAGAAAPSETVTLKVDRPFVFAVRDLQTGAVLFLGRILDASVGAPTS
jgi:serine protease inhibitor